MNISAVFDCMVYLQAVTNAAGPAFACFRLVDEGRLSLVVSPVILAEVREVLNRPALQRKFPHLTTERVGEFLQVVDAKVVILHQVPEAFSYPRDPDDEPYINLAIAAGARYLVSRDKDLLDLMNAPDFRRQFSSLTILDPPALLRDLAREAIAEKPSRTEAGGESTDPEQ